MSMLLQVAWRNVLRNGRRSLLTATAMGIAVVAIMAMMSLTDGMYGQMRRVIIDENIGHLQIHHQDYVGRRQMYDALDHIDDLEDTLARVPGVTAWSVRMYGNALLGADERTEGAQLLGIVPEQEAAIRDLSDKVVAGAWLDGGETPEIVLGRDLARKLRTDVGGELVAFTQAADGSYGTAIYEVVGVVFTGVPSLDRGAAFLHLDDLQELLALQDRAHEVVVLTDDRDEDHVEAVGDDLRERLADRPATVRAWWDVDPSINQLFSMQGVSNLVMMFFFFGVSAVGVVNTMQMSVLERTREFGVLRALGMRPGELVRLVMAEAVVLGVLAVAGGVLVGLGAVAYLMRFGLDFSVQGEGYELGTMTFDPIVHGTLTPDVVWQPVVGVLLFTFVAAIWPSLRASRLTPVDALRED